MNINGYALITGAGSGIGLACAYTYAREGASGVAFADIDKLSVEKASAKSIEIAKNPDYRAIAIEVDVVDESSVERMIKQAVHEFGRIDYAVNSAGVRSADKREIADMDFEAFDRVMKINVNGVFNSVKAEVCAMKKQNPRIVDDNNVTRGSSCGVIINIASLSGLTPGPNYAAYGTSKHAVVGLTKIAAIDSAKHDIRINCVAPSFIITPMLESGVTAEIKKHYEMITPLKRLGHPDEVADVVLFLNSSRASYVTGSCWPVTGGLGGH